MTARSGILPIENLRDHPPVRGVLRPGHDVPSDASFLVWAFAFAGLVERVLGGASVRYARITYLACAVAFLGLALVSLRDLWLSTREVRDGAAIERSTLVLESTDG